MKPTISFPDFDKLDIRVGTIVDASKPEWSRKLLKFTVDFGEEIGQKTIFSGIKEWYSPEDFLNKQFVFLINLAPKKMGDPSSGSGQGGVSEGMMLMADDKQPIPLTPTQAVQAGVVVR